MQQNNNCTIIATHDGSPIERNNDSTPVMEEPYVEIINTAWTKPTDGAIWKTMCHFKTRSAINRKLRGPNLLNPLSVLKI
jgi:hypothetical protein